MTIETEEAAPAKKPSVPGTAALINKMRAMLARRLMALEKEPMDAPEKEMTLLGSMARTLGKLEELQRDRRAASKPRTPSASPEMVELRLKIAARIEQLNGG